MRALRLHGAGDLRLHDEPDPQPRPGHSLIKVGAVGLCGSDLHWFGEGGIGDARIERPLIPGHELGGVAIDGPHAGRVVAIEPAQPCRTCDRCREGNPNLCPAVRFAGHGETDGGACTLMSWPDEALFPLPEPMTVEDAAVLEPLGVAVHSWDLGHVRLGDRVAVVGAGPIGLFVTQLAARGLTSEVLAVDPLAHRLAAAIEMGADSAVTPDEVPTRGDYDVVFEMSGSADAVRESVVLARPGGRVVLTGIPDDDTTTFPAAVARRKGLTVAITRRMRDVYPRAITLAMRGQVDLRSVVTNRFGLADAEAAFTFASARGGLKVVIRPND